MSHAGKASGSGAKSYFNEAERLDPRNVNLLTEHALFYIALRRFPEALQKLDQVLNITPDDLDTLALQLPLHRRRATCREPRRCSLRCALLPPTPAHWEHKLTRQSWSVARHKSSLG